MSSCLVNERLPMISSSPFREAAGGEAKRLGREAAQRHQAAAFIESFGRGFERGVLGDEIDRHVHA